MLLEDLGDNRDSRVDRVGDHKNKCLRCILCYASGEVTNDASVNLEKIISGAATLVAYIVHIYAYSQYLVIYKSSQRICQKWTLNDRFSLPVFWARQQGSRRYLLP